MFPLHTAIIPDFSSLTRTAFSISPHFRPAWGLSLIHICIVLASGGYPVEYKKGYPISGLEEAGKSAVVFHAGTKKADNGDILTNGGRVLGVTATGDTLPQAIANAYAAAKPISFQDMHFRTDIGKV